MTIEELLEIERIKALRMDYSDCVDNGLLDDLIGLFTEDAVCEFGESKYGSRWQGHDVLRQNYGDVMKEFGTPFYMMHIAANPVIRLTGKDTAKGRWSLLDFLLHPDKISPSGPLALLGVYEDTYRKEAGKWKFSSIRLHLLWPQRALNQS